MNVLVVNQTKERVMRQWLARWLKALSLDLGRRGHPGLASKEIVVAFVTPREMKRMNQQFRGRDYATDILSFDGTEPETLGELVLCARTIREQSRRTGLSPRGELGYMLVHGVLHLLGYDHEVPADEARMFPLQDEIYAKLEKRVGLV